MGTKSTKKAKTRLDAYYRLAKDQGYRARSAFKLIQLNRKYDFLAKSRVLVDLCAAPGGWCQVAAKHMPIGSKIVGVDLVPIAPIRGVKTFIGDITDDKTRKVIQIWLKREPVDCVVHDGAPNVGGAWGRELFEQNVLVLCAVRLAANLLRPGGWFVTKVFRSQDFQKLIWVFKQLFEKVEATKPLASRMESAEIFVVCAGYKAPKHIDPKMFNTQAVFSDVSEEKIFNAAGVYVTPKNNQPQGYDDFYTIIHNVATMSDFLRCDDPKAFLASHHEIRFPEEDRHYLKSKYSRKELVFLCQDLQQVGEGDRKKLIRWRDQLIREQEIILKDDIRERGDECDDTMDDDADSTKVKGNDDGGVDASEDKEGNKDIRNIAKELLEVMKKQERNAKKKSKKVVDRKLRQVRGLINHDPNGPVEDLGEHGIGLVSDGLMEEGDQDESDNADNSLMGKSDILWELRNIPENKVAAAFDEHAQALDEEQTGNDPLQPITAVHIDVDVDMDGGDSDNEEAYEVGKAKAFPQSDFTHVGNSLRVIKGEEVEYDVDNYGNYILKEKSNRIKIFETAVREEDEDGEMGNDHDNQENDGDDGKKAAKRQRLESSLQEAGKQSKWQRRVLNIDKVLKETFPKPRDPAALRRELTQQKLIEMTAARKDSSSALLLSSNSEASKRVRTKFENDSSDDKNDEELAPSSGSSSDSDETASLSDDIEDEDIEQYDINEGRKESRRKKQVVPDMGKLTTMELIKLQRKQVVKENKAIAKRKQDGKKSKKQKDQDDNAFEEIPIAMTDPTVRARTLAIATAMLSKKTRREILDNSVNKYMHNDDAELPDWFLKDEQRNCKVQLPITADQIEAERRRFLELNARPSKRVMEAMGRKRRRAQRMLRGMIEKGKSDPKARERAKGVSVRTLMRAKTIKGEGGKKKGPLDKKAMGEKRREKQRVKKQGKRR